jgi:ABC-type transport system substrate-binding protein
VAERTLVLERNPDYRWGPSAYRDTSVRYIGSGYDADSRCRTAHLVYEHRGPAFLDRVVVTAVPDAVERSRLLEAGALDVAEDLPRARMAELASRGRYWFATQAAGFSAARHSVNCLSFDPNSRGPVLYDVELWNPDVFR